MGLPDRRRTVGDALTFVRGELTAYAGHPPSLSKATAGVPPGCPLSPRGPDLALPAPSRDRTHLGLATILDARCFTTESLGRAEAPRSVLSVCARGCVPSRLGARGARAMCV